MKRFCSQCGRVLKPFERNSRNLCKKHLHQFEKFGEFKDNNPRGVFDPNEIKILKDHAEIDTYDSYGNVMHTFLLDIEDVKYLEGHKWRSIIKRKNYACPYLGTGHTVYFHKLILDNPKQQVDHINRNTLDNRKSNLRIVSNSVNMYNQDLRSNNTSGFIGVTKLKNNKWKAEISWHKKRYCSPKYDSLEEAVYHRYLFEEIIAEGFFKQKEEKLEQIKKLSKSQKENIQKWFENRLKEQVNKI